MVSMWVCSSVHIDVCMHDMHTHIVCVCTVYIPVCGRLAAKVFIGKLLPITIKNGMLSCTSNFTVIYTSALLTHQVCMLLDTHIHHLHRKYFTVGVQRYTHIGVVEVYLYYQRE